jgi:hypothetical protein
MQGLRVESPGGISPPGAPLAGDHGFKRVRDDKPFRPLIAKAEQRTLPRSRIAKITKHSNTSPNLPTTGEIALPEAKASGAGADGSGPVTSPNVAPRRIVKIATDSISPQNVAVPVQVYSIIGYIRTKHSVQ